MNRLISGRILTSSCVMSAVAMTACGASVDEHGEAAQALGSGTPTVVETRTLAPLAGKLYTPAAGQEALAFHGTDLGWTVAHKDKVRILFGDTFTDPVTDPFPNDDTQGEMPFGQCPAGDEVEAWIAAHPPDPGELSWQRGGPPITFATQPGAPNQLSFIQLFDGGVPLEMGPLRVPVTPFSDGRNDVFAIFSGRFALQECRAPGSSGPACDDGLTCDPGVGSCFILGTACVVGVPDGERGSCPFALPCVPTANGVCRDTTSSVDDGANEGRSRSAVVRLELGVANRSRAEQYTGRVWAVNKFFNPVARTVRRLLVTTPKGIGSDYTPVDSRPGERGQVLVWGRPTFLGSQLENREAQVYFAYSDMPRVGADGAPTWNPRYFTGLNSLGIPQFSSRQVDAAPLDLGGGNGSPHEAIDFVNQMSVSWVAPLKKWVMFYGGDASPGLIPLFNPGAVPTPEGATQVRFADQPWGPWTPPQTLLRAGDPFNPNAPGSQYGPGGILFHPFCAGTDCVPGDVPPLPGGGDIGRMYGSNIVDCWTEDRGRGNVDVYWNVSTHNPYQVVLMKTRHSR